MWHPASMPTRFIEAVLVINATIDLAYNETFVILKPGSGLLRFTAQLWQLLVCSHTCPGEAILIHNPSKLRPLERRKVQAAIKGRYLALITLRKSCTQAKTRIT